jgi:hypothetical protein
MEIKISVLFRTTFAGNGAVYYGVHDTTDLSFGTDQYKDPFIGNGAKLVALAKQTGNRRNLFRVDCIQVGTRKEVDAKLKTILDGLDYESPKTLNSIEGWPVGRKPTPEHRANVGKAMETAAIGNLNALGQKGPTIDIDAPANTKLKWFNDGKDQQKMILCDAEDNPIKADYKGWKLGKLHKNPYVHQRIQEARDEKKASQEAGESESEAK